MKISVKQTIPMIFVWMDMNQNQSRQSIKYVYCQHHTAFGREAGVVFHRIIHSTPTTLYIDSHNDFPHGWRGLGIPLVIKLNRAELENEGRAWSKSQRRFYYPTHALDFERADGEDFRDDNGVPDFVEPLGLSIPFNIEDIETAYIQKAKQVHPDKGGSIEDFIYLRKNYEKALAFFQQTS